MSPRTRSRAVLIVAAAVIAAVAATTGLPRPLDEWVVRIRTRVALARLGETLSPDRTPAARFTAIGVTGTRAAMRGAGSHDFDLDASTSRIIVLASRSSSAEVVAAGAAAFVIEGKATRAIALLEAATSRMPDEPRLWSDLAAANLEASRVQRALVAADRALRVDPHNADALYNRGLALARLGLPAVAADAWRRCLPRAADSRLAASVREQLRATDTPTETERWKSAEPELFRAAAAGDTAAVARITAEFPRLVRASSDVLYLSRWADAFVAGDVAKAERELRLVRAVGDALRRRGESIVWEMVAAIDDAAKNSDSARLARLAAGYQAFLRGRTAYSRRNSDAERELRAAAASFAGTGSPMQDVVERWIASVLIDLDEIDRAALLLTELIARQPKEHRALIAESEYLLGMCETLRGRWNAAADLEKSSSARFRDGGETLNAAQSDTVLAAILDAVGQPDAGWDHRIDAFRRTSTIGPANRVLVAVGSGTRAAMRAGDRELALSLLDVEMELLSVVRDPLLSADMLTRRVRVQHERGAFDDRDTALARARNAIAAVKNEAERTRLTIELDAVEGVIVRRTNPQRAIALLDRAAAFYDDVNRRLFLPDVLLQRGRAHLAAGDEAAAARDFLAGIDEVEKQRQPASLDLRARMFDTIEGLFDEAIALEVRRGNREQAFAFTERARARSLLDRKDENAKPVASVAEVAQRLDRDTLLLEFAVLPDRVVIFAIRDGGMRVATVDMKADEIPRNVGRLLRAVQNDLDAATDVVLVPDKVLQRIPFAQYLVATHTSRVVPSASLLRRAEPRPAEKVLVVGNPAADPEQNLEALPAVEREVEALGSIYGSAKLLVGPSSTAARFLAEAPAFDVIHFAGHGQSDDEALTASLLFARTTMDSGRLYTSEIAEMRLTRAPLVVLAACGTLRGRAKGVEGMPSLARSFLEAGASTVVGTLWDIDDEKAGRLLASFHRHRTAGDPAAVALRKAQLEAIARGGDDALPKNWAPFVVYTTVP